MSKITGIGGVFLDLGSDTMNLLKWYQDVLGVDVTAFGVNFLESKGPQLLTFDQQDEAILNFSVDDLEQYMSLIKDRGVVVHKEIVTHPFGKFAQIKDFNGNILELAELNDSYNEMVLKEINEFKESK